MNHAGRSGLTLGVLGGVSAAIDGVEVNLGGPRQRAVLGVLLAARGNVVTLERIVDAVWESDPPAAAVGTVQTYVSNLRRALEPGRPAREVSRVLVTTGSGYALRVDPDAVDAWLFENLVVGAASIEDAETRRAVLDEALSWWVGEPFADLGASAWVVAESVRLHELRWTALERMGDALLTLGANAEAEARARLVTVEAPLREDAWRLLALAQHAAGRTGDAVATLRRARDVLADELGIDPGMELVRLEQQLVHREVDVPTATTAEASLVEAPAATDIPSTAMVTDPGVDDRSAPGVVGAPAHLRPLVGRDRESDWLKGALTGSARLVTITGPGGIGKTRLALAVAQRSAALFDGGARFVTVQNVGDEAAVWSLLAQEFDVAQGADDPQTAVMRSIAGQPSLLVLDSLDHLGEIDAVVSALLAAPALRILATSRRPLLLAGEQEFALDALPLPVGDSVAAIEASAAGLLFCACARAARPTFELSTETAAAVAGLCRRLDGFPLALELAAAQLRFFGPAALLAHLDEHRSVDLGRGVTAADRPDRHRTLGATIAYSYDLLTDVDQVLFRRLGVFAGPVTIDAVSAVAGVEPLSAREVFDGLVRLNLAGLVRIDSTGEQARFGMFDTIRDFARHELDRTDELAVLRRRHLGWCRELTVSTWLRFNMEAESAALAVVPVVVDEVRAAVLFGLEEQHDDEGSVVRDAVDVVNAVAVQWLYLGSWAEAQAWISRALELQSPDDRSRYLELRRLRALLGLMVRTDDLDAVAEVQQLVALAPSDDDLLSARLHLALGLAWANAQDYESAMQASVSAIRFAERAGAKDLLVSARITPFLLRNRCRSGSCSGFQL